MMKKFILPAFLLLVLVQWFVPAKTVWEKDRTVRKGKAFKFETEPVDPSDPIRGKYISLSFRSDSFLISPKADFTSYENIFVEITEDSKGFAMVKNVTRSKPEGNNYIQAKVYYVTSSILEGNGRKLIIRYPFEEFYMDEYNAPKADSLYNNAIRDTVQKTYAIVHVYRGDAVIRDVLINDKRIKDWFK